MWNSLRNPQAMLNNAINNNPELKSVLEENGNDYRKAFYAYAEKKGIDPNQILNAIK